MRKKTLSVKNALMKKKDVNAEHRATQLETAMVIEDRSLDADVKGSISKNMRFRIINVEDV